MDNKNFWDFLNEDVPLNNNIQKYMMVTRNKLREYGRIAISYSGGSDSDISKLLEKWQSDNPDTSVENGGVANG